MSVSPALPPVSTVGASMAGGGDGGGTGNSTSSHGHDEGTLAVSEIGTQHVDARNPHYVGDGVEGGEGNCMNKTVKGEDNNLHEEEKALSEVDGKDSIGIAVERHAVGEIGTPHEVVDEVNGVNHDGNLAENNKDAPQPAGQVDGMTKYSEMKETDDILSKTLKEQIELLHEGAVKALRKLRIIRSEHAWGRLRLLKAGPLARRLYNQSIQARAAELADGDDLRRLQIDVGQTEQNKKDSKEMTGHQTDRTLACLGLAEEVAEQAVKLVREAKKINDNLAAERIRLALIRQQHVDKENQDRQKEYYQALEASNTENVPSPELNQIYLKVPVSQLDWSQETQERDTGSQESNDEENDVVDFFTKEKMDNHQPFAGLAYQSVQASLEVAERQGEKTTVIAVIDSGAAYCGMRLSFLQRHFPHLVKELRKSEIRFRDASKRLMPVVGTVDLEVTVGSRSFVTQVFVFPELGANLLLGVNALDEGGLILDVAGRRLFHRDEPEASSKIRVSSRGICHMHPLKRCEAIHTVLGASNKESRSACKAKLVTTEDLLVPAREDDSPKEVITLALRLEGVNKQRIRPVRMEYDQELLKELETAGITTFGEAIVNPTSTMTPLPISCGNRHLVKIPKGTVMAREILDEEEEEEAMVCIAAVLEKDPLGKAPRPLLEGGIEDLAALGFSLDGAINPTKRRKDGSYEELEEELKMKLYEIAHRWWYVWSTDAKVPRISYLVVIDIPADDSNPVKQAPYPIPVKLRKPAMDEVNKLLKAGLIEPSMSNWASPTLVRVKKDSTPEDPKVKLACDFRRLNSQVRADAGGLGTQSEILNGLGGRQKWIGLADAAGGFYQYALSPASRHRSAFCLPTSMGGTLFQWVIAPYGMSRCPAGYSRGMQFVLKGLSDRDDWAAGSSSGGATSWVDDICMRADSFEGFADVFETVLSRLAAASMTLKGTKCELLRERLDLLGFVVTPHGLMMQTPKLDEIMAKGIPNSAAEIKTFLGAVTFYRRFIPRLSLLSAPMTAVLKAADRAASKVGKRDHRGRFSYTLSDEEKESVRQSYEAVCEHLASDAVVAAPCLDDPLAEFVLCTDASDVAVGGALLQWQHPSGKGPGPPPTATLRNLGSKDPIMETWRTDHGWELRIIGFYSKTLVESQRNYPAFDKEGGAALLCVRHWSDLISYHPTTLFTDSSVAASMLTKHMAPPRLQRWGMELGTYLPYLRIAYRKGANNGLADLLSRFPTFKNFTRVREDEVELPEELFEEVGLAEFRASRSKNCPHLSAASYPLLIPKGPLKNNPDGFWSGTAADEDPAIPGRGLTDRMPAESRQGVMATISAARDPDSIMCLLNNLGAENEEEYEAHLPA